jgi:hypothetical protein
LSFFVGIAPWFSILSLASGAACALYGLWGRSVGRGAEILSSSFRAIGARRYSEAEDLITEAERASQLGVVRRISTLQRAVIAMRRGQIAYALTHVDASLAVPRNVFGMGLSARSMETHARAMRAFLRASAGDIDGAKADMREVKQRADAAAEPLAMVELARAVVLERAGNRAELRAHIEAEGSILFEALGPRERAIVRGYQRMLKTAPTSVYRESAARESSPMHADEPALDDWVRAVAPGAAPFIRSRASSTDGDSGRAPAIEFAPATPDATRAVAAARAAGATRVASQPWRRLVAVWLAMVAVVFGVWQLTAKTDPLGGELNPLGADPSGFALLSFTSVLTKLIALLTVLFVAMFAMNVLSMRRATRRIARASAKLARGEVDAAILEVAPLCNERFSYTAAQAHLLLAQAADRKADLDGVIHHVDHGLARLARRAMREATSDMLYPELVAERAFALAARDRCDESTAELAMLKPPYPYIDRAELRVRLVQLVRRGELEKAALLVERSSPDLPLSRRDELLADIVRAAVWPERVGGAEIARLKDELREYSEGRRWLESIAPLALDALHRATQRDAGAAEADEHEAESETQAEQEADALGRAEEARFRHA